MSKDIPSPEEISLSPSKDTYDAVQSDVTPISAIKELIDNAIDNWERVYNKNQDLIVKINYDFDEDIFSIEDNGGGLEEENIEKLFALGETTKSEIDTPIGAYGVGAKKAIVKIGKSANLVSRYKEQDFGFGYTIDQSWLEDQDNWDVTKEAYDDITPGCTRITISDLKLDVGEIPVEEDEDSIGAESAYSSQDFFARVEADLSDTYEEYLSQNETFKGDLVIEFNGERIGKPSQIDWSFTPFDGFYPRTYKQITLKRHNLDYPVHLDITVGLTREGSQDNAGTDIFCQNRKVVSNNDGTVGGFGRGDLEIGDLSATNSRLRVRMYFRTEGDADRLPWDTQKNGIDEYDSLMQEAYEWFEKIVYPYWQASSYGKMSRHLVKPYRSDSEQAANNGTLKRFSYKDRTRLSDRPNRDFQDAEMLNETLKRHLELGISAPQLVSPKFRPAYNSAIEDEDQSPPEVRDIPTNLTESEVREILRGVRKLAREDVEAGIHREAEDWWKPVYDDILEEKVGDNQKLETVDQTVDESNLDLSQDSSVESGGKENESAGSQQTRFGTDDSSSGLNTDDDSAGEENSSEETPNPSSGEPGRDSRNSSSDQDSSNDMSDQKGRGEEEQGADGDASEEDRNEDSQNRPSSRGPDDPTGYREVDEDRPPVVMTFTPENRKLLCDYLGLSEDVDRDQFMRSLKDAILSELIEVK